MGRPPKPKNERADAQMGLRLTHVEREQLDVLQKRLGMGSAAQVVKLAIAELYQHSQHGMPSNLSLPARHQALIDALDRVADECQLLRRQIKEQQDA